VLIHTIKRILLLAVISDARIPLISERFAQPNDILQYHMKRYYIIAVFNDAVGLSSSL